jgi:hypothetical protein
MNKKGLRLRWNSWYWQYYIQYTRTNKCKWGIVLCKKPHVSKYCTNTWTLLPCKFVLLILGSMRMFTFTDRKKNIKKSFDFK